MIQQLDTPQNYHRNLTFTIACATFGGFLAIFLLAYIRGTGRPWQVYYLFFAIVCLLLLTSLALSTFPPRAAGNEGIHLNAIGKLLRNPILLTYGLGVYLYTAAEIGMYFWIPKFFEDVHGVPAAVSNPNATTFLGKVFPSLPAFVVRAVLGDAGHGTPPGRRRDETVWNRPRHAFLFGDGAGQCVCGHVRIDDGHSHRFCWLWAFHLGSLSSPL